MSGAKASKTRHTGVLSTIGNTPLIPLNRLFGETDMRVFAKLEMMNPGGSLKDRTALHIIEKAFEQNILRPGMTVVESSSGNMGIGLAQICLYFGLTFICVVDPKTTKQNITLLETYGAHIDVVTEPDPKTGEFLQRRIQRVQELLEQIPGSFWPRQYSNLDNAFAHHTTMHEIMTQLDGQVDYLFCATSTCGTLRGCSEYLRQHGFQTKVVAVDAKGSVIFGGPPAKRLIPGHGAARRPELYQPDLADHVILVSDQDCLVGCHRLLRKEAILAGGSSGGVVMALDAFKHEIPSGARCVLILCDRGERYLDTVYSADWIQAHFGDTHFLEADAAR
jgi:2,3-diaminopropionate biosynthesis protein SbnA